MPTYTYYCDVCDLHYEKVKSIKSITNWDTCECGEIVYQKLIYPPIVVIPEHMRWNSKAYMSPIDGTPILNKKQRIEDMARSNCMEYEPGMREDVDRRVKEDDLRLDKLVDETVEKEIEAMPAIKRERLENEMARGLTAEPVRL